MAASVRSKIHIRSTQSHEFFIFVSVLSNVT